MALGQSPSIVTDGLAYYHDMNNIKSYAGPAIQNLMTSITPMGTGTATGYSSTSGTETVTIPQLGTMTVSYNLIQNNYTSYVPNSASCCPSLFQYANGISVTPSTLYTYGLVYKCDSGYTGPNYMYRYEYTANGGTYITEAGVHSTGNRTYLGNGWWWAWGTFTTTSTTNWLGYMAAFYYQYSSNTDKLSVAKVLLTQGNYTGLHPKYWPNVNTTRATTAALKDLTNTSTITTTADLVYNSDNTFSFNNKIGFTASVPGSSSYSQYTRIIWVTPSVVGTVYGFRIAMGNSNGNNADMALVFSNNGYPAFHQYTTSPQSEWTLESPTLAVAGQTYMIAATVDRGSSTNNVKLYVNGQLVATGSNSGLIASASDTVNFGGATTDSYSTGRMFSGNIYAAMHYNRILSSTEILQNFNALRGRFGL